MISKRQYISLFTINNSTKIDSKLVIVVKLDVNLFSFRLKNSKKQILIVKRLQNEFAASDYCWQWSSIVLQSYSMAIVEIFFHIVVERIWFDVKTSSFRCWRNLFWCKNFFNSLLKRLNLMWQFFTMKLSDEEWRIYSFWLCQTEVILILIITITSNKTQDIFSKQSHVENDFDRSRTLIDVLHKSSQFIDLSSHLLILLA